MGSNVRLRDILQNVLWQCFEVSSIHHILWCNEHEHLPNLISLTIQEWGFCRGHEPWSSTPYQESSCDYCNANQPVITLRACQVLDGTLCEPPFSSMWPHSWQKSHPVTGLHLNSLQQEYADWDIHPPAIVPLLISSHRTFSIWSFSQKLLWGPPGLIKNFSKRQFQTYGDWACN